MDSFRREVLKIDGPRRHKVNNSLGVYDAYKYIRKNRWFDIGRPLTEHEFYSIVKQMNNYLAENLLHGKEITLPCKMGTIELRKREPKISIKDGVVNTSSFPVDWDRTLKLWYEDEEAYKERILVKAEEKEVFKVFFNKKGATFNNKSFYEFEVNRDLKRRLKQRIKSGAIDAFKLYG